ATLGSKREDEILMAKALQEFVQLQIYKECPTSGILWAAIIEMAPRPQRQTRRWLNRAVTLTPDIGDFWGLLYKFEHQYGTEEQQKEVLTKCIAAEPKHGEKWQQISKAVENSHQPVEAILKKLAITLGKEEKAAKENKH
ncbi:protein stabilized1, partial [Tanacetum coccineum]